MVPNFQRGELITYLNAIVNTISVHHVSVHLFIYALSSIIAIHPKCSCFPCPFSASSNHVWRHCSVFQISRFSQREYARRP